MASIRLESINKTYSGNLAVNNLNLEVQDGEFVSLLGPSGCGKSTTLNIIAGLISQDSGNVYINDKLVNELPPEKRELAMVFQSYALYPTMNTYDNISFPLKSQKLSKSDIDNSVHEVAELLKIDKLLNRKPHQLSGGERQRVALGRAIVRKPQAFLLDEPLANIDAKLRISMRAELRKLHEKLGITFIYVTHDQLEAVTLSDQVAVINKGQLVQYDTPDNIFYNPKNVFVGTFVGSPNMNIGQAIVKKENNHTFLEFGKNIKYFLSKNPSKLKNYLNTEITVGIRPDDVIFSPTSTSKSNYLSGKVFVVEKMFSEQIITIIINRFESFTIQSSYNPSKPTLKSDDNISISFPEEKLFFFDKSTGELI
tara:strand:- start:262 stop:1365 length:1104 start_codon:yes stop_codon:yes gene_type:complete